MTMRARGRVVGALFLVAFVAYGGGSALVDGATRPALVSIGAALMLANSLVVAGIGVLMLPVVRRHHERSAYGYLAARLFEAVAMAVGVGFLLSDLPDVNLYAYRSAMLVLGLGSILFCRVLLREKLVPAALAMWGIGGYAVLAAGSLLELLGWPVSLVLSIPGGLFEVALGVLLLAKGLRPTQASDDEATVSTMASPSPLVGVTSRCS